MPFREVENVHVAEKLLSIIAIRGYATFVDKQLIGVMVIMSNDAISRQEAIEALCNVCGYDCDKSEFVYDAPQDEQVILCPEHYVLTQLPSAQPEIVRCKECMNHGKEICYFWSRFYGTINTPDDGFCHKADRRTDG